MRDHDQYSYSTTVGTQQVAPMPDRGGHRRLQAPEMGSSWSGSEPAKPSSEYENGGSEAAVFTV